MRRANRTVFPEAGKWGKRFRVLDVVSSGVQRALRVWGFTPQAITQAKNDVIGIQPDGTFSLTAALPHAEGVATGLIRDKIRSKLGVYRGMARGKLLSFVIALSPEMVATAKASPLDDFHAWNENRVLGDRGYNIATGGWDIGNENLRQSVIMDTVAYLGQKIAEGSGLNKILSSATEGMVKL